MHCVSLLLSCCLSLLPWLLRYDNHTMIVFLFCKPIQSWPSFVTGVFYFPLPDSPNPPRPFPHPPYIPAPRFPSAVLSDNKPLTEARSLPGHFPTSSCILCHRCQRHSQVTDIWFP